MFSLAFCVLIMNHFSRSIYNNNSNDCDTSIASISLEIQAQRLDMDRQKLSLEHGTANNLWWKSNFKQVCFESIV